MNCPHKENRFAQKECLNVRIKSYTPCGPQNDSRLSMFDARCVSNSKSGSQGRGESAVCEGISENDGDELAAVGVATDMSGKNCCKPPVSDSGNEHGQVGSAAGAKCTHGDGRFGDMNRKYS